MNQEIVQVKIHPAIGVARVGNSTNTPFIGPESPDQRPLPPGSYKDADGRVIKQDARFRLYGYDREGKVVRELKLSDDDVQDIRWTVHLANKKAAWYQFHIPLDIPEAAKLPKEQRGRRNAQVTGQDRHKLVNDPGLHAIRASMGESAAFDTGKIMDRVVPLGSIRTEPHTGRLLVTGGDGASASWSDGSISGVANNDTWYDNVSDGPVTAEITTIQGKTLTADGGAWVVVGPPHYAPGVKSVRTLYDLIDDLLALDTSLLPRAEAPEEAKIPLSYADDVEPILSRFCQLQWVNHGFATQFGHKGPHDFLDPGMRERLSDPGKSNAELRRQIYVQMRDYERDGTSPVPWPWLYGDAMTSSKIASVRQHIMLSPTQDLILQRWALGHFTPGSRKSCPDVDTAPLQEQPGLLDRAALENCAADAFHPGSEVTWPIRHLTMYCEPFRIKHRTEPETDYGDVLTHDKVFAENGPLHAQGPGDLTRWMAAPWQCDTASCRSGYEVRSGLGPRYSPYLPTFWPAQMPNHVLKRSDFNIVNDTGKSLEERRKAFRNRAVWLRGLKTNDMNAQRKQMISDWYKVGIVEEHPYTGGDGKFPQHIQVESLPGGDLGKAPDDANLFNLHVPEAGIPLLAAAVGTWSAQHASAEDVEAALVHQAIEEAVEATGYDTTSFAAGYLERLDPFHEAL
ncbi:LodA/GoxA family CTQ-dependent oxidase [Streptomyces sp. Wb2n-11]|uniref:LodA/GoxA family CTQ-dependent oxidase n=1 Tax=Streptomyces sp. Wb2n-11 TaxID=1030533 RepID=UPI000AC0D869|nr:LodA/GoxA family CTQ-dependent oxidase [Streptomyces sp. Wb2n-11]